MRLIILTAFAACAAAPAFASSIEVINGSRVGVGSMITLSCADCPPLKPQEKNASYQVPILEEGVQKEEIREIDGQKVIVRTDRWMGGSPTIFYQKLSPDAEAAMIGKPLIDIQVPPVSAGIAPADGVDKAATTAAVYETPAESASDFSGFELRMK